MIPSKLRLLADSLERNFITAEDRKGWTSDLRGFAKSIERRMAEPPGEVAPPTPADLARFRDYIIRAKYWLEHGARAARAAANIPSSDRLYEEAEELRKAVKDLERFMPAGMK